MRSRLTTRQWVTLRGLIVFGWLVLALLVVAPVLAQDGGDTATGGTGATSPDDLQQVAAELAPLLVGAALIERLIEALFGWAERALRAALGWFKWLAQLLNGGLFETIREVWDTVEQFRQMKFTLLHASLNPGDNPDSSDPKDWPLEKIEKELEEVEQKVLKAERELSLVLNSERYNNHRKNIAMWISIVFGLVIAFGAHLRLFGPLGITVEGDLFEYADVAMAGILMGLGTDYVHQFINVFTKGQKLLGKRAQEESIQIDLAAIRAQIASEVEHMIDDAASKIEQKTGGHVEVPRLDEDDESG